MRAFIAIDINEKIKENILAFIEECKRKQNRDIRYVAKENLHITMKFLGEIPAIQSARLMEDLKQIQFPAMELKVQNAGGFPNVLFPKVIWVGAHPESPLERLFLQIEEVTLKYGVPKEDKKFHPHISIARLKGNAERGLTDLIKNCILDFGNFQAGEFVLVESKLTREKPVYTRLQTYPFQGGRI